jgi:putative tryptophan/tyrosine transport system substrate-binding protein
MDRRRFLVTSLAGALAAPLAAGAQPAGKVHHVGVLSVGGNVTTWRVGYRPFIEAMRDLDYVEGRNLAFRPAFADGKPERLPTLVAELLRANVDVIVASANREAAVTKRATSSLPIVAWLLSDPVTEGLVASLARPGGNITGLTNLVPGLSQKYVEVLREAVPSASRFAVIISPVNPNAEVRHELEAAGRALGVAVSIAHASGPDDFDRVLARAKRDGAAGIIATSDGMTFLHRQTLAQGLEAQAAGNLLVSGGCRSRRPDDV